MAAVGGISHHLALESFFGRAGGPVDHFFDIFHRQQAGVGRLKNLKELRAIGFIHGRFVFFAQGCGTQQGDEFEIGAKGQRYREGCTGTARGHRHRCLNIADVAQWLFTSKHFNVAGVAAVGRTHQRRIDGFGLNPAELWKGLPIVGQTIGGKSWGFIGARDFGIFGTIRKTDAQQPNKNGGPCPN